MDTSNTSRPIIATTTVNLPKRLEASTKGDLDHLDVVKQFTRRLVIINLTTEQAKARFAILTYKASMLSRSY